MLQFTIILGETLYTFSKLAELRIQPHFCWLCMYIIAIHNMHIKFSWLRMVVNKFIYFNPKFPELW